MFAAEINALVGRLGDRLVETLNGGPKLAGARAAEVLRPFSLSVLLYAHIYLVIEVG